MKGYAGTGKTTLTGALVKALEDLKYKCVLLAPTGRAAKVFARNAGHSAYTIHRRIYRQRVFSNETDNFTLNNNLHRQTLFIVDEASQILEPQLLPLLCAAADGEPLIGKFILIGDHKQLPAVVVQPERDTRVSDACLRKIGLTDLSNSLFERLYGLLCGWERTDCYGWLDCQGRMHPAISDYVNQLFYAGRLRPVPLPHQLGKLPFVQVGQGLSRAIAGVRLGFLPVRPDRTVANNKANAAEAETVAALVEAIGRLYALNSLPFDAARQVGVIVPFRNQIALVRQALSRRGIADAGRITVDTVECYQGSQRDHIIFSTTISQPYQLGLLSAVQQVDGRPVDRKLNVAVTRARMQLLVVGNDLLLSRNPLYRELISESEIIDRHIY